MAANNSSEGTIGIEEIKALALSTDVNDRIRAATIIPEINETEQTLTHFRLLSNDRVESVRTAIVDSLVKCKFDNSLILYILGNAVRDPSPVVRQHAALIYAKLAPTNLADYALLIKDPEVGKYALSCFTEITRVNGISSVVDIFEEAIKNFPDDCAAILLEICKMMKQEDEKYVVKMCMFLVKSTVFAWHMHEYAAYFTNREPFLEMLSPAKAMNWRLRYALQQATLHFIPDFGAKLIQYALRYSGDLVAIIRDGVVPIWIELVKISDLAKEKIRWLSTKGFKQRLIVAKVITAIGVNPEYMDIAKRLANDKVSNVRYCLASRLNDKELFNELFSQANDPDINQLFMNQSN